jgi:hypothetical protein
MFSKLIIGTILLNRKLQEQMLPNPQPDVDQNTAPTSLKRKSDEALGEDNDEQTKKAPRIDYEEFTTVTEEFRHVLRDDEVHSYIAQREDLLNRAFEIIKSALVQPSIHANSYKILFAAYQKLLKEGESLQEDLDYFLGLKKPVAEKHITRAEAFVNAVTPRQERDEAQGGMQNNAMLSLELHPNDPDIFHAGVWKNPEFRPYLAEEEREEIDEDREPSDDEDYYDYYDEPDVIRPNGFLFEVFLNPNLQDKNIDRDFIQTHGAYQWTTNYQYHNPLLHLIEIILIGRLESDQLEEGIEAEDSKRLSQALLANYLRFLKLMLDELDKVNECTFDREFSMWCRVIPHALLSDMAVISDKAFLEEIDMRKMNLATTERYYDIGSDEIVDYTGYSSEETDDEEEIDLSQDEEEQVVDLITETNLKFSTLAEIENTQCTITRDVVDRWLHVDYERDIAVPVIDQKWHDFVSLEDGYTNLDCSEIETIDVRSQDQYEAIDDTLPPSLHLDILRLARRAGIASTTPHAIAEMFLELREYIHDLLKQVIVQKVKDDDHVVTVDDITDATTFLDNHLQCTMFGIGEVEEEGGDNLPDSTDLDVTNQVQNIQGEKEDYNIRAVEDVEWECEGEEDIDEDLGFNCTIIPVPQRSLADDILTCYRVGSNIPATDAEITLKVDDSEVIALKSIIAVRCPTIMSHVISGQVDIQKLIESQKADAVMISNKALEMYVRFLYTGNIDEISVDDNNTDLYAQIVQLVDYLPIVTENETNVLDCLTLSSLISDHTYSDFVLKTNDTSFHLHRNIIGARSEYFAAMFTSNLADANTADFDVSDTISSPELLTLLMEYLYCNVVDLNVNQATELIAVAKYYMLERLVAMCELVMARSLSMLNSETILRISLHFESTRLFEVAESFIVEHTEVLSDGSWSDAEKEYFELLCEPINMSTVVSKLQHIIEQISAATLEKIFILRLERYWKPSCIHFIARHINEMRYREEWNELGNITDLTEQGTGATMLQVVENVVKRWQLLDYESNSMETDVMSGREHVVSAVMKA